MKRSRRIALTIMASLALTACDDDQSTLQALYNSQQECIEDWGIDECEADDDSHWHGPHYYYHNGRHHYYSKKAGGASVPVADSSSISKLSAGAAPTHATSTRATSVSRGGFGSSASTHGSSS